MGYKHALVKLGEIRVFSHLYIKLDPLTLVLKLLDFVKMFECTYVQNEVPKSSGSKVLLRAHTIADIYF